MAELLASELQAPQSELLLSLLLTPLVWAWLLLLAAMLSVPLATA
jgi:hypothetical protein